MSLLGVGVAAATSGSVVWKKTCAPSPEAAVEERVEGAVAAGGPVETSVVVPPERS